MLLTIVVLLLAISDEASCAGRKAVSMQFLRALKNSPTEVEREAQLAANGQTKFNYVFDFAKATVGVSSGKGGRVVAANAGNFPALINLGLSMIVGYLEPCGLIVPHIHPRSSSLIYVAQGELLTGFYQEAGANYVTNIVGTGQATVFPKGSIHFEQNTGCTPAILVSALNDEDPGFLPAASFFQELPADVVGAGLGGVNASDVESQGAKLPAIPSFGIDACLRKCGLAK